MLKRLCLEISNDFKYLPTQSYWFVSNLKEVLATRPVDEDAKST